MKISESQIEDLYQFTRKHFVYHFDVQTELVDHLANDIEEIWLENPKFSFEEARDKSFKKFGIFGFMDVIEAKQKQMNKRYWKIMWRFVKEWFTLPKVVTTVLIFLVIFSVLKIQFSEFILLGALLILTVFDIINQLKLRKQQKKKEQKQEKIFLLEAMIGQTRNGFSGLAFINFFNLINLTKVSFSSLEIHWVILISFSATIVVILFYVTGYVIPQKAEELLQETYPEYKLVKNL
jgi:ABC-type multidrug transport system fused ATPase/permease subunit